MALTGGPNLDYHDYMAMRRAEQWRSVRWLLLLPALIVAAAVWYVVR